MTDLATFEEQVMRSVQAKVHDRLLRAREAEVDPAALGDPDEIATAMVAALPLGHTFDVISGPFYDTAGLTTWLGITRQGLHQKVGAHSILACTLAEGGGLVYPTWQFLETGATIPSLADVLRILAMGTSDNWMVALWMRAPNDDLDGLRPSEWLRTGKDPDQVLSLAREIASKWSH